ncbi:DUF3883 domain-containing protein [Microcella alkaliphila]|uniref:DUF3883 domain-containing protein n=1 Tax=Microcella alkaliphila TaxID=279828 RepID=UPI001374751A|nr:DUF3883 domain-containing protein [Microcella alkaliphila]
MAYLAAALDHETRAKYLVETHLVSAGPEIVGTERILAVSARADRATKLAIAAIILEQTPPPWLQVAVVGSSVHFEIIPTADLEALSWIGDDLEQLLIDAARNDPPTQEIIKLGVGRAAELVVLGALAASGEHPLHVSEISDGYGYDIESTENGRIRRLEVKGCTGSTSASFHLSRNEYEKSRYFGSEWMVVQVSFADEVLVSEEIRPWHVLGIRELSSADVLELVPPDPEEFRWEKSALLTPKASRWRPSAIAVPLDLCLPGTRFLGAVSLSKSGSRTAHRGGAEPLGRFAGLNGSVAPDGAWHQATASSH